MTQPVPVLINAQGGTAKTLGDRCGGEVEAAFQTAGLKVDVRLLPGAEVAAAAAGFAGQKLVVVGGGDGTLGTASGELIKGKAALGILPLGTRNHLARDLGIPADLKEAAAVIAAGHRRKIDLARVNGRVFVNNASIGAYPQLVEERDKREAPKWLATIPATVAVLNRLRHHRLRLAIDDREQRVATPLLFIGNNRYKLDAGKLGLRDALDDGKLSVFAVSSGRRRDLIGFALRTFIGRVDLDRDFATLADTPSLRVDAHPGELAIALDGEVMRLATPLHFEIDARALTVIAPLEGGGATP